MMKTRAAVLRKGGQPWELTELDLDEPKAGEVLIRFEAAGLCHSDEHIRATGTARLPLVGGHEGAGVIEKTGPGVTRVKEGDRVACSYIPVCGTCRYCSTGRQNLCDAGKNAAIGCLVDGTFRFHDKDEDLGGMCVLGTFSERAVISEWSCVKIEDDIPFELAALVSCGVTTGFCSATTAGDVRPGDTVVIFGTGGVGMNAVQGAAMSGARHVIAVDPVEFKREQAQVFGATHTAASVEEAMPLVTDLTWGVMADKVVSTMGVGDGKMVEPIMGLCAKGGRVVWTNVAGINETDVSLNLFNLTLLEKQLVGSIFGSANPRRDVPHLLRLYQEGKLKLDELITRTYTLDDINIGYQDMRDGKNIRGMLIY
jgi:S-(hydroxymethyl)glutathione dehydrogenase/alcohol dehydrogenase